MILSHADSAGAFRVLLVDHDAGGARELQRLTDADPSLHVAVTHAPSLAQADAMLADDSFALVLLEAFPPGGNGLHWLASHRALGAAYPVVVKGSVTGEAAATAALAAGAEDYLDKSESTPAALLRVIRHAVDRHRLREQLDRTTERFRHLLDHARDLIAILDLDGSVVYASPSVERLLGVAPEVLIGSRLWDRVHVEDVLPMHAVILELATEPHAARECEFRLLDAHEGWRTFEAVGQAMTDGGSRQILINARDVSVPRRAKQALEQREQDLRQAQKMVAIGRLAGGVAHDFSNVLTVILGATERLLDQLPAGRPLRPEAESIRHAAERAVDLTAQLLTFSRRHVMAPAVFEVADVLGGVGRFLRALIGEDVQLELTVERDTGSIRADRTQIEQVLLNLAVNARDAMPGGGRLSIALAPTLFSSPLSVGGTVLPAGPYVTIRVEDTGVGMDAETQERAFEPFFTTKGPDKGTGIGLATVYGIVSQSGGAVSLSTQLNVGTTVTIYFPRVTAVAAVPVDLQPAAAPAAAAPAGGTETVLLVEDEHEVRELVRDMLEMAGYAVLEAELPHVAEAICRDHRGPIHLLLTDVVMPELNGREVAKRVCAARPDTKVLFMSGYPEYPGSSSEVSAFGGAAYLAKPFDRRLLLTSVRGVLDAAGASLDHGR